MKVDTGQHPPHQGCKAGACCSPAKLWRTLQTLIKANDRKGLIEFFQDPRQEHILRVALTHRVPNDPMLLPASHRHQLIRYEHPQDAHPLLGKSLTDLNSLQLALLTSSESTVMTLLGLLRSHRKKELKASLGHLYGSGNTSLHLAVFLQRPRVVKALIDLGASPLAVNKHARSVQDCCRHPSIAALLAPKKPVIAPEQTPVLPPNPPAPSQSWLASALLQLHPTVTTFPILLYSTVHYLRSVWLAPNKKPPDIQPLWILS